MSAHCTFEVLKETKEKKRKESMEFLLSLFLHSHSIEVHSYFFL